MFTGLVDDVGTIVHVADTPAGRELRICCRYRDLADGESIAVNGACLTVREHGVSDDDQAWFTVAAIITTIGRTTMAQWLPGQRVNLERAMRAGDRFGGHMVLGHVDDVGVVKHTETRGDALLIDVQLPAELLPLMVAHGSVTVDGVSLTVNALLDDGVQISLIEYTLRQTTLGDLKVGAGVHVEADILAKHVERLLTSQHERFAGVILE